MFWFHRFASEKYASLCPIIMTQTGFFSPPHAQILLVRPLCLVSPSFSHRLLRANIQTDLLQIAISRPEVGQGNSAVCESGAVLFPPAGMLQVNGDARFDRGMLWGDDSRHRMVSWVGFWGTCELQGGHWGGSGGGVGRICRAWAWPQSWFAMLPTPWNSDFLSKGFHVGLLLEAWAELHRHLLALHVSFHASGLPKRGHCAGWTCPRATQLWVS